MNTDFMSGIIAIVIVIIGLCLNLVIDIIKYARYPNYKDWDLRKTQKGKKE